MKEDNMFKIIINKRTPSIKCKNCGDLLKPSGSNKIIGKDKKYCGAKKCQDKRISLWNKGRKNLEYVKERRRINQRKYTSKPTVKEMYKKYMKEYGKIYAKKRRAENEYVRRVERLRKRFSRAIKKSLNGKKLMKSSSYGIDFHKIAEYIGECPGKREDYEIDHIRPLSSFDLTKDSEIKKAFAPKNHQWLTKELNRKKGKIYDKDNYK